MFLFVWFLPFVQWIQSTNALSKTLPNFIFILSDDQDLLFNSSDIMPNLQRYIVKDGLTFTNAFVATPICCPSRTQFIAGRNYQNIGAPNGSCMSVDSPTYVFNDTNTLFQSFWSNNYLTGMMGKMTNDMTGFFCNDHPMLKGFSRLNVPCNFNSYYGTKYFDKYINGSWSWYNITDDEFAYETSRVGNATMNWLNSDEVINSTQPLMLWIGPHAPHYSSTPAAW